MLLYALGVLLIGTFTISLRYRAESTATALEMDSIGISEDEDRFLDDKTSLHQQFLDNKQQEPLQIDSEYGTSRLFKRINKYDSMRMKLDISKNRDANRKIEKGSRSKKSSKDNKKKSKSDKNDHSSNQDNAGSSGQGQDGGGGGGAYVSPPDFFSFNDPGDDFSAN
ncbi:hypothetical protein K449DRAFT_433981 [Hypoxylon sp. EC38]|nr:hypothetical protein K449DRAFT_433981 [Hypoxylon sp. EC38]